MAARLKVFTWSDGFHAFTVAASSRPKALAAWGVGQDLFKSGLARQIEQGPDHDKRFTVEVRINSNLVGTGIGHSKKDAEQAAAEQALKLMGIIK